MSLSCLINSLVHIWEKVFPFSLFASCTKHFLTLNLFFKFRFFGIEVLFCTNTKSNTHERLFFKSNASKVRYQSKSEDRWWFLIVAQACTIYFFFLPLSFRLESFFASPLEPFYSSIMKSFQSINFIKRKKSFLCDFLLDVSLVQTLQRRSKDECRLSGKFVKFNSSAKLIWSVFLKRHESARKA